LCFSFPGAVGSLKRSNEGDIVTTEEEDNNGKKKEVETGTGTGTGTKIGFRFARSLVMLC
jgi:hypothetical protein